MIKNRIIIQIYLITNNLHTQITIIEYRSFNKEKQIKLRLKDINRFNHLPNSALIPAETNQSSLHKQSI